MSKNPNIENKKAYHDYYIEETLECGVSLRGNEVKSIRNGKVSIKEAWIAVQGGNLVARGIHITKWETANNFDVNENREIRLLAHKKQITELADKIKQGGYTLVPLKMYFSEGNKCKLLIGLARGKHNYDKRECLKESQAKRDIARALKERNK